MTRRPGFWISISVATLLWSSPGLAADPFRTGNSARSMGPSLEAAFTDFFQNGNYKTSVQKLDQAQLENPNEPLVYTLKAAIAYLYGQQDQIMPLTEKIQTASESIRAKDATRYHLYRGIAQGLKGSTYYLENGLLGLAQATPYISSMLLEIDKAHRLSPEDPEVNLIVAYIDTVLQKYDKALIGFSKAAPSYLNYRGQALVYRDTKNYDKAIEMVDKALAAAPNNPELFYLKGQISALQRKPAAAVSYFDQALVLGRELPASTTRQILRERKTQAGRI